MSKREQSEKIENGEFKITEEPFYLPQGNEIAIFEAAQATSFRFCSTVPREAERRGW